MTHNAKVYCRRNILLVKTNNIAHPVNNDILANWCTIENVHYYQES